MDPVPNQTVTLTKTVHHEVTIKCSREMADYIRFALEVQPGYGPQTQALIKQIRAVLGDA